MTNCTSPSVRDYESRVRHASEAMPGVRFTVARISFGRRIELARRVREAARKVEFLEAGGPQEKLEAALLAAEIDRAYLEWGLLEVEGLEIDGETATVERVIDKGPMELGAEILARIKAELGLSEEERKN